ncbi:unnamed protein product, partial [Enterobius vermicularis]|uniref:Peptidase_S9 domain-containing protein n=1 Tax=Enterobius vermicularis TaxID=51028 RepID=A0A0N4UTR9_ENTVE
SSKDVFRQRYFYNGQYYKGNGPAILFLGGEGPENGGWIFDEGCPHMKWANDSSAALFALEHRFYGKSRPFEKQTTENLKYLSSRQAIEDIAEFIKAMDKKYSISNHRWIVYGGSYSAST